MNEENKKIIAKKYSWIEEYKTCSCSFISHTKKKLMGYCPKHATSRKYATKIPRVPDKELGYVGT